MTATRIPHTSDWRQKRREAYPSIGDQLDALWKGGADAEAMRARVLAIKSRIPKPPTA